MSDGAARLAGPVGLALRELELCRVRPEETVIVYTDGRGNPELQAMFSTAAQTLGATVLELTAPPRVAPVGEGEGKAEWWSQRTPGLTEALKLGDLIVDVSGGGLFHAGQEDILASGTRIIRAREPFSRLQALFPSEAVVAHAKESARVLAAASEIHFTSTGGTDLRVRIAGQPVTTQYGIADEPGRWDHFGTALAALAPAAGEGDGDFVLEPGDVAFFSATVGRYLREQLRVRFEAGRIVAIEGGIEAEMLLDLIRRGGEGDARRLSHLGWGCDPRADWNVLQTHGHQGGGGGDVRSVDGSVVIAFGANLDLGGTSDSIVHVDLATRATSVAIDGEPVIDAGAYVLDSLRPAER